jgi:hypothetical protein
MQASITVGFLDENPATPRFASANAREQWSHRRDVAPSRTLTSHRSSRNYCAPRGRIDFDERARDGKRQAHVRPASSQFVSSNLLKVSALDICRLVLHDADTQLAGHPI